MATVKIADVQLDNIANIKDFVGKTTAFANRLELHSDRWIVDAKSIMGIFSLDLSKPVEFYAEVETDEDVAQLKKAFERFDV